MNLAFLASLGAALPLAPYLGQVGTRSFIPNAQSAGSNTYRSRVSNTNPAESVTALRLIYPNFYVEDFSSGTLYRELGNGGVATVSAAIEYPAGTFTQVTWAGSPTHTIASNSIGAASDACVVSIPAGAQHWIRTWYSNASGVVFSSGVKPVMNSPALLGDQVEVGTGLTDNTMGGTYTTSGPTLYGPCAILATTIKPSVAYMGDSRVLGENDTIDATGMTGYARRIAQLCGVINMGDRGDSAFRWLISHTNRLALAQYTSHIFCGYGFNDVGGINGRTSAQLIADLQSVWNALSTAYPSAKILQETIAHGGTTSTDSYASVGNQTAAAFNPARVTVNATIRTAPAPLAGFVELADVLESSRDSGKWKATGVANVYNSGDSVHPNQTGYLLVRDSGYIGATTFAR